MDHPPECGKPTAALCPPRPPPESKWQTVTAVAVKEPGRAKAEGALLSRLFWRNQLRLLAAMLCGVLGIYIHRSSWVTGILYGEDWQVSWLWWFVAVPVDVTLAIYFTRWVGSWAGQIWLFEVSRSVAAQRAGVALLAGLVRDERAPELLAALLSHDPVAASLRRLLVAVMGCPAVRAAAADVAAEAVARSAAALDEEAGAAPLLGSGAGEALVRGIAECLGEEGLRRPLAGQAVRLLDDSRVRRALRGLLAALLQDARVREALHARARGLAGDSRLAAKALSCCSGSGPTKRGSG